MRNCICPMALVTVKARIDHENGMRKVASHVVRKTIDAIYDGYVGNSTPAKNSAITESVIALLGMADLLCELVYRFFVQTTPITIDMETIIRTLSMANCAVGDTSSHPTMLLIDRRNATFRWCCWILLNMYANAKVTKTNGDWRHVIVILLVMLQNRPLIIDKLAEYERAARTRLM